MILDRKLCCCAFILCSLSIVSTKALTYESSGSQAEQAGELAEQAGELREALTHYIKALSSSQEGSPREKSIREKIIAIAQKLDPPPTLPQEAERRFFRGVAAMKVASSVKDFESAAREFDMATIAAPWYADAYYNTGIAHNTAKNYSAARRNFSFYLLASPNAPDTAAVKAMVYENEYLAEREETREQEQQRQQEATRRADEERHRVEQEVASVLGRWEWRCDTGTLPIRLLPSGTQSVVFEIWVEAAVSAWRGSRELQYDAALRRFVAGADSRNNGPMVIAVLDANQLLYSATSDGRTATCTLSR